MLDIITLKNGIRLALDKLEYVKSVSFCIFVESGSVHEEKSNEGISHFIEHMVFKGTKNRTALQIANDFDAIGGQCNAYTAKEMTCYYAKTLDNHIFQGFDILSDMFLNPLFSKKDVATEKKVIKEEIAMSEDNPEDLVNELLSENIFANHTLSNRILGNNKSISKLNEIVLKEHHQKHYCSNNTVISVSGNFNENEIVDFVSKRFECLNTNKTSADLKMAEFRNGIVTKKKDIEQNHICIGFNGYSNDLDEKYYSLSVLNSILGGGMSSRLFQKVREEQGLCYSIYSYPVRHKEGGIFCIYLSLNASSEQKALSLIKKEIEIIKANGIKEDELSKVKEQLKAGVIMGLESTSSRASHMGRSIIMSGKIKSLDDIIENIDKVNIETVKQTANEILNFEKCTASVVGNPKEKAFYRGILS